MHSVLSVDPDSQERKRWNLIPAKEDRHLNWEDSCSKQLGWKATALVNVARKTKSEAFKRSRAIIPPTSSFPPPIFCCKISQINRKAERILQWTPTCIRPRSYHSLPYVPYHTSLHLACVHPSILTHSLSSRTKLTSSSFMLHLFRENSMDMTITHRKEFRRKKANFL